MNGVIHISTGGPSYRISVKGKIMTFEDHPFCGPIAINPRNGEALKHQRADFLEAVSLWYQQGKRVEDGLCVWDHEPEPIIQPIGKRNGLIVGYKPAVRGS